MKNKMYQVILCIALILLFGGVFITTLGAAINLNTKVITENGPVHAVITGVSKPRAEIRKEKEERKRRKHERRRFNTSYKITWYQDIEIKSQDSGMEKVTLMIDEESLSHEPSQDEQIYNKQGFQAGEELDLYITDEGRGYLAEDMDTNINTSWMFMSVGATVFVIGILLLLINRKPKHETG